MAENLLERKLFFQRIIPTAFLVISALTTSAANSATLVNLDSKKQTVIATENGVRSEVELNANSQVSFCDDGCFALFPSGTMLPLNGSETVEVKGGEAQVVSR